MQSCSRTEKNHLLQLVVLKNSLFWSRMAPLLRPYVCHTDGAVHHLASHGEIKMWLMFSISNVTD